MPNRERELIALVAAFKAEHDSRFHGISALGCGCHLCDRATLQMGGVVVKENSTGLVYARRK